MGREAQLYSWGTCLRALTLDTHFFSFHVETLRLFKLGSSRIRIDFKQYRQPCTADQPSFFILLDLFCSVHVHYSGIGLLFDRASKDLYTSDAQLCAAVRSVI